MSCLLCSAKGHLLYENLTDRYIGTPGTWNLVRCASDNHLWLSPRPIQSEIERSYDDYYTHEQTPELSPAGTLKERIVRSVINGRYRYGARDHLLRNCARWATNSFLPGAADFAGARIMWLMGPARGRLLDVGCGNGAFLARMHSLGWSVSGIEPDERAADLARKRLFPDVTIVNASFETSSFGEATFDVVTSNQVIEHVEDPICFLGTIKRLLVPGGTLVVTTPNGSSQGHTIFGRNWFGLDPPRHLHIFSTNSLVKCTQLAGLTVVQCRTTASAAAGTWRASACLRASGNASQRLVLDRGFAHRAKALLYYLQQQALVRRGHDVGEYLVLIARKPTK